MNVLVVSTYPPMACGIGTYAAQQVTALRGEGHPTDVLSPCTADGDHQTDLCGGIKALRLLRYFWAYDRIYVHYTPAFYYQHRGKMNRLMTSLTWLFVMLIFGRRITFVIHETDYNIDDPLENVSARRRIDRWYWRMAEHIQFHSERERHAFSQRFSLSEDRTQFEIVDHGRYFVPRCSHSQSEARRLLGIPEDKKLLLCIGFIQPHKGFDRVIKALAKVDCPNVLVRIVGSVRIQWQPALDCALELHRLARHDPRCEFIENYVDDETFDTWIVASDFAVVPYHEIWSSGVAARSALLGRPIIASRAGGLSEQLPEGSFCFSSEDELVEIIRNIATRDTESSDEESTIALDERT